MRSLAIDCRSISKESTGVGNVLFNTLQRLKIKECSITLFFDRDLSKEEYNFWIKRNYNIEIIKCKSYVIWEQILFPLKINKRFDYVWFPSNTGSFYIKAKKIATIHDVIFAKSYKEIPSSGIMKKELARFYRRIFAKHLAKKAVRIYTVSKFSKHDIIDLYKVDNSKVKVIYNGLDEKYKINLSEEKGIKENYILSFGSTEPRKNTELMVKVYKNLIDNYKDVENIKLVLYGFKNYDTSLLKTKIDQLHLEKNIKVLGYVSDDELLELYKKAKVFCFLSSFEGFGLPILESMACATPVVTLNNSCIPEIVGNAGVIVNTNDINDIANEIYSLISDIEKYNQYIKLGKENIKKFNWDFSINELNNDLNMLMK